MNTPSRLPDPYGQGQSANLADILERVLDKGVVIAGDITMEQARPAARAATPGTRRGRRA